MKRLIFFWTFLCAALGAAEAKAEKTIFDFEGGFDASLLTANETRTSIVPHGNGKALRIDFPERYNSPWPGVSLKFPEGLRDFSAYEYLAFDVENVGEGNALLGLQLESTGGEKAKRRNVKKINFSGGEKRTFYLFPNRVKDAGVKTGTLFHMIALPPFAGGDQIDLVDMKELSVMTIYITRPSEAYHFVIDNIRACGSYHPNLPANPMPFVDAFGQYLHDDWPGKIHSSEELASRTAAELAHLEKNPGPPGRDSWGGWADGPSLAPGKFFRVEKVKNKWWFVDPDGKLFVMNGLHGVRFGTPTPLPGRDEWWKDFPGKDPAFKDMITTGSVIVASVYKVGDAITHFNFNAANLKRKYGENWRETFIEVTSKRLRSWGLTSIAANSDNSFYASKKLPYYFFAEGPTQKRKIEGSVGYWGKFYDVFDPDFRANLKASVKNHPRFRDGGAVGDPFCIGIGIDNELGWGTGNDLALGVLRSPVSQPAKKIFVEDLKAKYGKIEALDEVWGSTNESWESLLSSTKTPDPIRAKVDLDAFFNKLAGEYFSACRDTIRELAPGQLYLGCRFAHAHPMAEEVAAKYCDVVSFNHYENTAANMKVGSGVDKPFLIGEFHFTAPGSGYFSPSGLIEVSDQKERAACYKRYWLSVLEHPNCVGANWFMYQNQPISGSQSNGENYATGFVDIVDSPYLELVAAAGEIGYNLYKIRSSAK